MNKTVGPILSAGVTALPFLIVLVGAIGGALLASNLMSPYGPRSAPKYHSGQMVKMKAFDTQGMVIGVSCAREYNGHRFPCTYTVRFAAIQMHTNTRLLASDGAIDVAPIAKVRGIREYELEAL